jgi:hypothetical protein
MARSRLASRLGGGEAAETLRATSRCQSSTRRASFAVEAVVMVVGLACTLPLFGELRAYLTSSRLPSRSVVLATAASEDCWMRFVLWKVLASRARVWKFVTCVELEAVRVRVEGLGEGDSVRVKRISEDCAGPKCRLLEGEANRKWMPRGCITAA